MHVGGALARRGVRTLVVDVDPQASLTQGLIGPVAASRLRADETLAGLYEPGAGAAMRGLVLCVGFPHLGLVAGHERMGHFNLPDPWTTNEGQYTLRDGLAELGEGTRSRPERHLSVALTTHRPLSIDVFYRKIRPPAARDVHPEAIFARSNRQQLR
jgi:hypothetical protein